MVVAALALALAACGTSGAAPEAPPTSAVPTAADGEVVTETAPAPSLANNMLGDPAEREIAVYLPPSYATSDARYPVVYFLAGYEERIGMFGQHTDELWAQMLTPGKLEFIVVEVDGISALGGNFYANSPVSGNAEDFLTVDRRLDGVLVVFNATPHEVTVSVDSLVGDDHELSPVLANGSDDVVQATTWDAETGTVTVPARTVTALVDDTERGHHGGWHWPWDWSWPWGRPGWSVGLSP